ncbi:HORMA domain-containing protein 1-like [Syngnathus typhle]|uniref:HORMA domain-containing protein 1-like n=1 Tax=Syngnathus typhle TaxID=161592 RepID=UPI002A6B0029|nr:HORMA domain-containing protein 1-like [Syngnathus typhle]
MDILRTNGVKLKVTLEDTKRATVVLIRQLSLLMQNLNVLPDHIHMSMKLYYYDNVTPAIYEPPGFKEGRCDSLWFEGTAVHFEVGDVQTALHAFHVRISADTSRITNLRDRKKPIDTKPTDASGKENIEGPGEIVCVDDEKPFGDESAPFKDPEIKRKATAKQETRMRRKRQVLPLAEGPPAQLLRMSDSSFVFLQD